MNTEKTLQYQLVELTKEVRALKQSFRVLSNLFPYTATAQDPDRPDSDPIRYNTFRITYADTNTALISYCFPVPNWLEAPVGNTQIAHSTSSFSNEIIICSTRPILKIEQIS